MQGNQPKYEVLIGMCGRTSATENDLYWKILKQVWTRVTDLSIYQYINRPQFALSGGPKGRGCKYFGSRFSCRRCKSGKIILVPWVTYQECEK